MLEKIGLRRREAIVAVGVIFLFMVNAFVILYLRFFEHALFESLPAYPRYMVIRSRLLRPDLLIPSLVAICALFLGYHYTRRTNAADEIRAIVLAFALGVTGGLILILLW